MKSSALALAATLLTSSASAQVLQWDIEKRAHQGSNPLRRRDDSSTVNQVVKNEQTQGGYFATVKIGSNKQELSLQLDTGSSDVWVPYYQAEACQAHGGRQPSKGCVLGSFNPRESETFEDLGKGTFKIKYVDESGAEGDYFADDFTIGGNTVKNLTMGLGIDTDIAFGLFGVGYAFNEASNNQDQQFIYPNLPVALQDEGIIKTIAYSLWLNDLDASQGSILFGGIDTGKYHGDLARLDIVRDESNFTHFQVPLYGIEAVSPSGSDQLGSTELPVLAVLDSGTTLSYIPTEMAEQAWEEVGARWEPEFGFAALPCSRANSPGHFAFRFASADGPSINVTMDELVLDLSSGEPPVYNNGPNRGKTACAFGLQNQTQHDNDPYLLGDTFLRSAYVVYDLVNNKIAIAPTKFNSSDSNVVAFPSHGAPIPSATAVSTKSDTAPAATGAPANLAAASGFKQGGDDDSESSAMSVHLSASAVMVTLGAVLFML